MLSTFSTYYILSILILLIYLCLENMHPRTQLCILRNWFQILLSHKNILKLTQIFSYLSMNNATYSLISTLVGFSALKKIKESFLLWNFPSLCHVSIIINETVILWKFIQNDTYCSYLPYWWVIWLGFFFSKLQGWARWWQLFHLIYLPRPVETFAVSEIY